MTDLVLHSGAGSLDKLEEDLLFERVATRYLELQDNSRKKIKLDAALEVVEKDYPNWVDHDIALIRLRSKEFSAYLTARRKEHLITSVVPHLWAAEMGSKLGAMAAEIVAERLENDPDSIDMKDLVAVIKVGNDMAEKVDRTVEEATETKNVQVNIDVKSLLMGLPPEQAQAYMVEVGRRMLSGGE